MSGSLDHSPAEVMRHALVALGVGTLPTAAGSWPIYGHSEPDTPDNVITLYDTTGVGHGRSHIDGEIQEHQGVQVRIRSDKQDTGYPKAKAIAELLDKSINRLTVTIGAAEYLVHAATRTGDVLSLGKESPTSKRNLFTLNFIVALRQVT